MSKTKISTTQGNNKIVSEFNFSDEQKKHIIQKLEKHWDKHGDSTTYEGIKMAKRVIRNL